MRVLTAEQQALAEKNINLAYYFANKYWAAYRAGFEAYKISYDDVRGEAMVALCEAVTTYTPDRGALVTVVGVAVKHRCLHLLTKGARLKRMGDRRSYSRSLDAPVGGPKTRLTLGDVVADKRDDINAAGVNIDLAAGFARLSPWQQDLLTRATEHSQTELAAMYGRSQSGMSRLLSRTRQQLQQYMEV